MSASRFPDLSYLNIIYPHIFKPDRFTSSENANIKKNLIIKKDGDPPLILPLCWRPLSADETTAPPETPAP